MSSSRWEDWEVCEKHDTMRKLAELRVSRTVTEKREVQGDQGKKELVVETKFYECLDGCTFLQSKPYDGRFGKDPARRPDPPDVADPPALAEAKELAAEMRARGQDFEVVVFRLPPEKENEPK